MTRLKLLIVAAVCVMMTYGAPDQLDRVRRAPRVKRVIGGTDVAEGAWPWLAHLTGKIPSGSWLGPTNYYCGGAILNKNWILTAAHCFKIKGAPSDIMTPENWHIKAGELEKEGRLADRLVIYPDYTDQNGANRKHDIALVRIEKDLPVGDSNKNIAPITLPDSGDTWWPSPGTECIMKGWGCQEQGGPLFDTAKQVPLPVQESSVCDQYFGPISNTRICAGVSFQNKGICAGDSGGPLVCIKDNQLVQAGLASFTSSSYPGNVPGLFTRISYYRDWIDDVIRKN